MAAPGRENQTPSISALPFAVVVDHELPEGTPPVALTQGHALKESVLAHELYGKGTDFDGGTDPVVRVDARRLRDKLREYYEGRSDPVVISLPKGSYVPVFSGNSPPAAQIVSPNAA